MALAQDQLAELHDSLSVGKPFGVFTYDGALPSDGAASIRERGTRSYQRLTCCPLESLPHHTRWTGLFETFEYIVLDRNCTLIAAFFGSHLSTVAAASPSAFSTAAIRTLFAARNHRHPGDSLHRLLET